MAIQDKLDIEVKFDFSLSTPKIVIEDVTNYSSEGIALSDVVGVFKITAPSGTIYQNTDFNNPDIDADQSLIFDSVNIPKDASGDYQTGDYTFEYTIEVSGSTQPGQYSHSETKNYDYSAPSVNIEQEANCECAEVVSKDVTGYAINGVSPSVSRTHQVTWVNPDTNAQDSKSGNTKTIKITSPDVYTIAYTTNITSTVTYTFSDGLTVVYQISGQRSIFVECDKSLCEIYCGMKKLIDRYFEYNKAGDYQAAKQTFEQLSLIGALSAAWNDARQCGKSDDANELLGDIKKVGNFTEDCGCDDDDSPVQVIPFCGGSGGSADIDVQGDSASGTDVTTSTSGSTTIYTVSLIQSFVDKINNSITDSQVDYSVSRFRSEGIPEGGRGTGVTNLGSGGGTINLTPGSSKMYQVYTGNDTLTASWTIQPDGTPMDGDMFIVDYRANLTLNGNNITIFGTSLTDEEAQNGNVIVFARYDSGTSSWYSKALNRSSGVNTKDSLEFWESGGGQQSGGDYAVDELVLYNTNPSIIYKCIQQSGSGTNPPPSGPTSNTWWQAVGDDSALYDLNSNIVVDAATGVLVLNYTLNSTTSSSDFLVVENGEVKKRTDVQTTGLANDNVWVGNSSGSANQEALAPSLFRSVNIPQPANGTATTTVPSGGGTKSLTPGSDPKIQIFTGTVTLANSYTISGATPSGILNGDFFIVDFRANVTLAGNSLTIFGISIDAQTAKNGDFLVYAYYDSNTSSWKGQLIEGGSASFEYGQTLFVDSVNGDDTSAVKGDLDNPYESYMAARGDAVAGDVIWIMSNMDETIIFKDGVNIHAPGVELTRSTNSPILQNSSGVSVDCTLTGNPAIYRKNNAEAIAILGNSKIRVNATLINDYFGNNIDLSGISQDDKYLSFYGYIENINSSGSIIVNGKNAYLNSNIRSAGVVASQVSNLNLYGNIFMDGSSGSSLINVEGKIYGNINGNVRALQGCTNLKVYGDVTSKSGTTILNGSDIVIRGSVINKNSGGNGHCLDGVSNTKVIGDVTGVQEETILNGNNIEVWGNISSEASKCVTSTPNFKFYGGQMTTSDSIAIDAESAYLSGVIEETGSLGGSVHILDNNVILDDCTIIGGQGASTPLSDNGNGPFNLTVYGTAHVLGGASHWSGINLLRGVLVGETKREDATLSNTDTMLRINHSGIHEDAFPVYQMEASTTDATTTELFIEGGSDRITIPVDATSSFRGYVTARQTGGGTGTAGDSKGWYIEGVIKNVGGSVTMINSSVTTMGEETATTAWSVTLTAITPSNALAIEFTGEADKDISVLGHVYLTTV